MKISLVKQFFQISKYSQYHTVYTLFSEVKQYIFMYRGCYLFIFILFILLIFTLLSYCFWPLRVTKDNFIVCMIISLYDYENIWLSINNVYLRWYRCELFSQNEIVMWSSFIQFDCLLSFSNGWRYLQILVTKWF